MKKMLLSVFATLLFSSILHAAETEIPSNVNDWLKETEEMILGVIVEHFPHYEEVNRQEVAANSQIQEVLRERARILVELDGFKGSSSMLIGKFFIKRVETQPEGSKGQKPSETNIDPETAAQHTAAGLAEIVCRNPDQWEKNLTEHFIRVGEKNVPNQ